jgi:copper chaperone CopZ
MRREYLKLTPRDKANLHKPALLTIYNRAVECEKAYPGSWTKSAFCRIKQGSKEIAATGKYIKPDGTIPVPSTIHTRDITEAFRWIDQGGNVGIYCGTLPTDQNAGCLAIIDFDSKYVDVDEDGRLVAPQDLVDAVARQSLAYQTRSGGIQVIVVNDLGYRNVSLFYNGIDAGEFRASHQYGLCAGFVNPNTVKESESGQVKKSLPNADGIYRIVVDAPIIPVSKLVLPEGFEIKPKRGTSQKKNKTASGAPKDAVAQDVDLAVVDEEALKIALDVNPEALYDEWKHGKIDLTAVENYDGLNAQYLLDNEDDLKQFVEKPGDVKKEGDQTGSGIDNAFISRLIDHRFSDINICRILYATRGGILKDHATRAELKYRRRDYLPRTIAKLRLWKQEREKQVDPSDESESSATTVGKGYSPLLETTCAGATVVQIPMTSLPSELDANADIIMIRGPPRSRKSYAVRHHAYRKGSANYIITKHEMGNDQYEKMVQETEGTSLSIVYLAGKSRCCNFKPGTKEHLQCSDCIYRVGDPNGDGGIHPLTYQRKAKRLLGEMRAMHPDTLKKRNLPFCVYHLLKYAESDFSDHPDADDSEFSFDQADICITVPNFLVPTNQDGWTISKRDVLIIDEDPTVSTLYPSTPILCSFSSARGSKSFHIPIKTEDGGDVLPMFGKVRKYLSEKRKDKSVRALIGICDNLSNLAKHLDAFQKSEEWSPYTAAQFMAAAEKDMVYFGEYSLEEKHRVVRKFYDCMLELNIKWHTGQAEPIEYLHPFLFPDKHLLYLDNSKKPRYSIYMISDNEPMVVPPDTQLVLVGSIAAELYAEYILEHPEYGKSTVVRYEITEFPYAKNYVYFVTVGEKENDEIAIIDEIIAETARQNKLTGHTAGITPKKLYPQVIFSNTIENQASMVLTMTKHGRIESITSDDDRDTLYSLFKDGKSVAMYLNGPQVRGIDVPMYDVTILRRMGFATPRWSAKILWADTPEERQVYRNIRETWLSDETTNAAFRTAPIYGTHEESAKVVVLSRRNLTRIYDDYRSESTTVPIIVGEEDVVKETDSAIKRLSGHVEVFERPSDSLDSPSHPEIPAYSTGISEDNMRGYRPVENKSLSLIPDVVKESIENYSDGRIKISSETTRRSLSRGERSRYDIVRRIVEKYLRQRRKQFVTLESVIGTVHGHPEAKKKELTKAQIEEYVQMLRDAKVIVDDQAATERYQSGYNSLTYIMLNPDYGTKSNSKPKEVKKTLDDYLGGETDE